MTVTTLEDFKKNYIEYLAKFPEKNIISVLKKDVDFLLSIIDSLRAGLSYYADEIAWKDTGRTKSIAGSREFIVYESFDGGELARAILEKEKP